jgi:outer membrane protein assembly factor BamB
LVETQTGVALAEIDGVLKVTSYHLVPGRFLVGLSDVDEEGELQNTVLYGYTESTYGFGSSDDGLSLLQGELLQCGQVVNSDEVQVGYYHVFDSEANVLRYKEMYNPWYEDDPDYTGSSQVLPRDWILLENGTVLFTYSGISSSETSIDTGVMCFDENDEFQWYHDWRTDFVERAYAITVLNDEVYVAVSRQIDTQVYNAEIELVKLSLEGELLETWIDPWSFNVAEVYEMLKDGDAIVAIGSYSEGLEIPSDPVIFKFDADGEEIWWNIVDNQEVNYRHYFTDVCITTDGNYVATASVSYDLPEIDPVFGDRMDDAMVVKFNSENGELMWKRYYRYIESDDRRNDVRDVCATSDGGVAFTGVAVDYTQEVFTTKNPAQKGWIVKLDAYGCLIPGCQDVGVEEQEEQVTYFTFGPNPFVSGGQLNLYLGNYQGRAPRFVVYDQQGREVASTRADGMNTTYMWVLPELAGGSYVLVLEDKGRVVQSELLVVE